jgi:hypothetical protein
LLFSITTFNKLEPRSIGEQLQPQQRYPKMDTKEPCHVIHEQTEKPFCHLLVDNQQRVVQKYNNSKNCRTLPTLE